MIYLAKRDMSCELVRRGVLSHQTFDAVQLRNCFLSCCMARVVLGLLIMNELGQFVDGASRELIRELLLGCLELVHRRLQLGVRLGPLVQRPLYCQEMVSLRLS